MLEYLMAILVCATSAVKPPEPSPQERWFASLRVEDRARVVELCALWRSNPDGDPDAERHPGDLARTSQLVGMLSGELDAVAAYCAAH